MMRFSASCVLLPFGLAFLLIGSVAFWFMFSEINAIYHTRSWDEVLIDLRSVEVDFPDKPPHGGTHDIYELAVEYKYEYGGKEYVSNDYRRQSWRSNSYESLALTRRELLRSGDGLVAYVNPDEPSRAIMKHDSLWFGLILILPLIFMFVGAGLVLVGLPIWGWLRTDTDRASSRSVNQRLP